LRESRKQQKVLFSICGSSASNKKCFSVFAEVPQATKSAFQHLRKFRKQQKVLFSICGSSASNKKYFSAFAEVPQGISKNVLAITWHL